MLYNLAKNIVTFFGIGQVRYAQGTIGSLVAFPICMALIYCLKQEIYIPSQKLMREEYKILFIGSFLSMLIFMIGIFFVDIYTKHLTNKDPSEIVIDEVAGQMLVIFLTYPSLVFCQQEYPHFGIGYLYLILFFLMPFSLFRLFDIFKPWPICWVDANIKTGIGVMLDDFLAALAAALTHYLLLLLLLD
jgi:phosphatidylglycerophosphatase A